MGRQGAARLVPAWQGTAGDIGSQTTINHSMTGPLPPDLLIGLCGRAGAGKTTVGCYLENEHAFTQIAFADPIVGMISALFEEADIPDSWMMDRALKERPTALGFSYRQLAQTLGTEWGRALSPDFWTRVASAKLHAARHQGSAVVVSDVRFPNEAAWLRRHGGILVRVERQRQLSEEAMDRPEHESEQHWHSMECCGTLHNDGSFATLEDQVEALLDDLRRGVPADAKVPR